MRETHSGFKNTRERDLLAHTIAQCPINPFMIYKNKKCLKESWDAISPFTDLIERVFDVQEFASDTWRPIDNGEIMTKVYTVIYQIGILKEDCEKWDERPNVDEMRAKLQLHFTDVQRNMRMRKN